MTSERETSDQATYLTIVNIRAHVKNNKFVDIQSFFPKKKLQ